MSAPAVSAKRRTTLLARLAFRIANHERLVRLYNRCQTVVRQSPYENIYYCCTQKTGSQWLRAVFHDPIVYRHTGLAMYPYVQLGLRFASFDRPLPERTIATHLYIGHPTYLTIPKPERHRSFFVLRDPRDIVVSWYFSAALSHVPIAPIPELRRALRGLDPNQGFRYMIDRLEEWGSFAAQRSWLDARDGGEPIALFRYEELARDPRAFLDAVLAHLKIDVPDEELARLCRRHTFARHSGGRSQGTEDRWSHYRKGVAGDWRHHFDRTTTDHFRRVTGDLVEALGYPGD